MLQCTLNANGTVVGGAACGLLSTNQFSSSEISNSSCLGSGRGNKSNISNSTVLLNKRLKEARVFLTGKNLSVRLL